MIICGLAISLAGCASGGGDAKAPGAGSSSDVDVARVVAPQLGTAGIAADPDSLSCDDDAELTEGSTVECSFTSDGQPVGLSAEVTSVDGDDVEVEVSTEAQPVPADVLATSVGARVGTALGATIDSTTCADDLKATVGASTTCTLTSGSQTLDVTVSVLSVDGGQVSYGLEQR